MKDNFSSQPLHCQHKFALSKKTGISFVDFSIWSDLESSGNSLVLLKAGFVV